MSQLPKGLDLAFSVAMGELGFCSTAWLFVREVALYGGEDLVRSLRDELWGLCSQPLPVKRPAP